MNKILFRYLFKGFLFPLLFTIIAFCSLVIIADLFGSLEDFIQNKATASQIFHYYLAYFPAVIIMIVPPASLFSSLYFLMQLHRHGEFIAMQACGVPLQKIFAPFLIIGVLMTLSLTALQLGPGGNSQAKRDQIMEDIKGNKAAVHAVRGIIYKEEAEKRVWYFRQLDFTKNQGEDVEVVVQENSGKDLKKYFARRAIWKDNHWTLNEVNRIDYDSANNFSQSTYFDTLSLVSWNTPPRQMVALEKKPRDLNASELWKLIDKPRSIQKALLAPYQVQFYTLVAEPLSMLVLLLIGLAEGGRLSSRHPTAGVFNALFILIAFYLIFHFFQILGQGSRIPPAVAIFSPLAAFTLFSLYRIAPLFGIRLFSRHS
ncbi:LptF/LptG family permease [Methylacidiphilum caldifontis]|uniref:Permease n=1 Tax=Methylacidiphilum caldifontis TaxID=2795386 RepID=A0A4Y8PD21_9BACT|nr:LptF/LptG family permease [Methylacidiphilum caldifontis]QSR88520.1 LptF/LptG family permease [Methylacidiphilum caldifontis]TFE69047.1 permease [Methylacidiphilum caldifontis]